jgi:hypothetical protein
VSTSWWVALALVGPAHETTPVLETDDEPAVVEPSPTSEPPHATDGPASEPAPPPPRAIEPPRFLDPERSWTRDLRPRRRTTTRFTDRPPLIRPTLRVAPGFSARLTGPRYAAFGLDALASLMFGLHGGYRQWGLSPELGYSLRVPQLEHRLLAGLGLVYGINAEGPTVGWLPRVVVPLGGQTTGYGVRNGLWFNFAENGFSVELSHQWLARGGVSHHELQATLGIDLMMLVLALTDAKMAWL